VIDLVLVVILVAYGVSGFRQGLALSALSLGGFVLGALVAILAVPVFADRLEAGPQRSFAVLAAVLVLAWLGQVLGAVVGGRLREQLPRGPARRVDQAFGAVAGLVADGLVDGRAAVVGAASGCVLLPGLPHLGLEHRAAWVEAELDGTVTRLVSQVGVDPSMDPDTAVLAMLLAAA